MAHAAAHDGAGFEFREEVFTRLGIHPAAAAGEGAAPAAGLDVGIEPMELSSSW